MKIIDLYNNREKVIVSFEIFPPKTEKGEKNLITELEILSKYNPAFISVTYGAGGSTQDKTLSTALKIQELLKIDPLIHFTCIGSDKNQIQHYLEKLIAKGINNILALRGDPPADEKKFIAPKNGFRYANELIEFIKKTNNFSIGGAGYPEGHLEAPDFETDMDNLKRKVDSGADYIITQLFYNNEDFYNFIDAVNKRNIKVPIIPGIMPVTNLAQIKKISGLCGASVPKNLLEKLTNCSTTNELCEEGIESSINQCKELESWGVPGFHFYTINKSFAVKKIIDELNIGAN